MQCCVPFCDNSSDTILNSTIISFHKLPIEQDLRAAWLTALGIQDSLLSVSAVVCSQHFLKEDFYETNDGSVDIARDVVPSAVQVCSICLGTDSQLFSLRKYNLKDSYENLLGYSLCDEGILKQALCVECAQRLKNFGQFRDKSLRAHALMMDLTKNYESITLQHMKSINREQNQLKSSIVRCTIEPDFCNIHIYGKDTESDETLQSSRFEVKDEAICDTPVDKDHTKPGIDMGNENETTVCSNTSAIKKVSKSTQTDNDIDTHSNDVVVKIERDTSDNSFLMDTNQLGEVMPIALLRNTAKVEEHCDPLVEEIKGEQDSWECIHCCEKFSNKDSYNGHVEMYHMSQNNEHGFLEESNYMNQYPPVDESKEGLRELVADCSSNCSDTSASSLLAVNTRIITKVYLANENNKQTYDKNTESKDNSISSVGTHETNDKHDLMECYVKLDDVFKSSQIEAATDGQSNNTASKYFIVQTEHYNEIPSIETTDILARNNIETDGPPTTISSAVCLRNNTKGEKNYCQLCKYSFSVKGSLQRHMKTHTGEKPFSCNLCVYKCSDKGSLARHIRIHTGEKPYSCKLCEYKSSDKSRLVKHIRTHTGEMPYSCNLCEYKSSDKSRFVNHVRTHTGEKPYSCNLCEYKCSSKSSLVMHIRTHTGEKPYSCNLCEYKSSIKSSLIKHMRLHTGEKPYYCNVCEYKGSDKSRLVKHVRTHTGEMAYSCNFCEYKSFDKSRFVNHVRTHTGEKPYSCNLCEYKCSNKSSLVKHIRTHTGEKPYSCNLCEYKSCFKSSLVKHIRTHTGEKPYNCNLCEYRSSNKSSLVKHIRTHTGEKPFSCYLCEFKCSDISNLARHIKNSHL